MRFVESIDSKWCKHQIRARSRQEGSKKSREMESQMDGFLGNKKLSYH